MEIVSKTETVELTSRGQPKDWTLIITNMKVQEDELSQTIDDLREI